MSGIEITYCNFNIHIHSNHLGLTSTCDSGKTEVFQWYDEDPLDIVYYRLGSTDMVKFHTNTGKV
jgi:hypothetical protein